MFAVPTPISLSRFAFASIGGGASVFVMFMGIRPPSFRAGPPTLVEHADRLDLDGDPGRELAHFDQRANGKRPVERFPARAPDLLAVADVGEVDVELDDVAQRSARGFHQR